MTEEKTCTSCDDGQCAAQNPRPGEADKDFLERQALAARMCRVKHRLVVLSGKGGVGKSTVAVNLAKGLAMAGKRVGLLDVDLHGPSVPKLLHLEDAAVGGTDQEIYPVAAGENLRVMSIGFLLRNKDEAVIWRGPMKYGAIKQFLRDVEWGELDYLIIDSPPGTGDEPLGVIQLLENLDGAIIVTTPQDVAVQDVRRSIQFCRTLELDVTGVVENMSGFICPHCSKPTEIFGTGGGKAMAEELGIAFLGAIPIDPRVAASGDSGEPMVASHPHSDSAKAIGRVVRKLLEPELGTNEEPIARAKGGKGMKIALPVAQGALCLHFGHCEQFALFDVDTDSRTIRDQRMLDPPPHEPGVLPRWLHEQGADVVIAGGMGSRAQSLFTQSGVQVVVGATAGAPEQIVQAYLDGKLQTGANVCDH